MRTVRCNAQRGFTLLELLVALSIFALLSVMAYGGLRSVLQQHSITSAEEQRLAELQKIYLLMQRDLEQAVPRPIRDEYGDTQPPLSGGSAFQFTRGGWSNPLGHPRSDLQRIGYAWVDDHLVRYVWSVLDRAQDTQPLEQRLSDRFTGMEVRFLAGNDQWLTQWPDPATVRAGAPPPENLPRAVEITLHHKQYGDLVWLFRLPDS
jgi:general secretion pathway protein J